VFDAAAVIAQIIGPPGKPPDQPRTGFVVDRVARQGAMERQARVLYRPWNPVRPQPAPGPPPPVSRGAAGCPRCTCNPCICPR